MAGPSPTAPHRILAQGPWTADQVTATFQDRPRPTSPAIEDAIAQEWQVQRAWAEERGSELFDGALFRLSDWEGEDLQPAALHLNLGPCGYREFVGTNLYRTDLLLDFDLVAADAPEEHNDQQRQLFLESACGARQLGPLLV